MSFQAIFTSEYATVIQPAFEEAGLATFAGGARLSDMEPKRAVPATVDDYIHRFPNEVQVLLRKVRAVVRAAAPDAEETISYRMPAMRQNGILVYYAAFKSHIGFYPPIRGDAALERAAGPFAGEKGNLRFPYASPIPSELIRRLTEFRVAQDRAAHSAEAKRSRPIHRKRSGSPGPSNR